MSTLTQFRPLKSSYVQVHHNPVLEYDAIARGFYWEYIMQLYLDYSQSLLTNRYLTVIVTMRNHAEVHTTELAHAYYYRTIDKLIDNDEREVRHLFAHLTYNPDVIIANLINITMHITYEVFHSVYRFMLEAKQSGVSFNDIILSKDQDSHSLVVTCIIDTECIREYSPTWYDRATLFADF